MNARSGPLGEWTRPVFGLLLAALGIVGAGAAQAATFYIRTDGGDAAQCNGQADAPYPGQGAGQACAWKHPFFALPTTGSPRIAGGDTLIVAPGDYMIGWGAPGAEGGRCYNGGRYDCYLPPIPSGPSASQKTRILGKGHDTGCAAPPKFWGTERVWYVLNLQGSSNVELACLDISDRSDCVESHSNSGARCERNVPPYGAWASTGIRASASRDVLLRDVHVHGLAHTGIHAGGLTDWTLERVRINANGWVGWDGDIGAGSSNSGNIVMRDIEIAWNGCGERWQTGEAWACWGQQGGGYGDGLGTATTGGKWLLEDAFVHHNTSDGIDLLYLDGAAGTSVTMRRVHAVANAGNQLKTKGSTLIENSVVVGSCAYFNGRDFMVAGDHCRAMGNAISTTLTSGQTATVRHNTIAGQGDCLILTEGGDSSARMVVQNNALLGQTDFTSGGGELTCGHYVYASSARVDYAGNLFWNVKASQCPAGSLCGVAPKLRSLSLAAFDAMPLADSPLVDKVAPLADLGSDFLMQPRPSGSAADIGALELQSDQSPPPTCSRARPDLSLSGPTTPVTAGSRVEYVLQLGNRDSAACSATTFQLARTVPAGWSGELAASSLTLQPGATGSVVLVVTSSATAATGTYTVAGGVASAQDPVHSASAAATYAVTAAPLSIAVSTSEPYYRPGQEVVLKANLSRGGRPVAGTTAYFRVVAPNGRKIDLSAVSNSDGVARVTWSLGNRAASGTYTVRVTAQNGSESVQGTTEFGVLRLRPDKQKPSKSTQPVKATQAVPSAKGVIGSATAKPPVRQPTWVQAWAVMRLLSPLGLTFDAFVKPDEL